MLADDIVIVDLHRSEHDASGQEHKQTDRYGLGVLLAYCGRENADEEAKHGAPSR